MALFPLAVDVGADRSLAGPLTVSLAHPGHHTLTVVNHETSLTPETIAANEKPAFELLSNENITLFLIRLKSGTLRN